MSLSAVLLAGAAIRFVVPSLLPEITDILASTVEISTPVDSFRSIKEAFFYLDHGMDVYDGGVVHHPPLLVSLLKLVLEISPSHANLLFNLLFTIVDVGIALKLVNLNRWYNDYQSRRAGKQLLGFNDALMAGFYMFNPLMILTCWSHSTQPISYFLIVELLNQVLIDKNPYRGSIAMAVAAYLSFTPVYLIVPLLALTYVVSPSGDWRDEVVQCGGVFFASVATLILLSFVLTALPDFLSQCYGTVVLYLKISPNMGLWWYLFTEMFDVFLPLYRGIFNLYSVMFIVPITVRFFESGPKQGDSFLAVVMCYVWLTFTKLYPIIGDLGLALSIFPVFKNTVIPHAKFLFITALTLIVVLLLAPIFYYCWIVLGNGNSNFFYSMNLIWGGVHVLLFLDFIWGRLVYDYIQTHDVKDEKKLRLTQI